MGGFENPARSSCTALRAARRRGARRRLPRVDHVQRAERLLDARLRDRRVPARAAGDTLAALRVQRNMARAHARAYALIHDRRSPGALVSWAHHLMRFVPDRPATAATAGPPRSATACSTGRSSRWSRTVAARARPGLRIDVPEARGTCDFVGVNLYGRRRVRFSPRDWRAAFNRFAPPAPDAPRGDPGAEEKFGEPFPQGIRAPRRVARASREAAGRHRERLRGCARPRAARGDRRGGAQHARPDPAGLRRARLSPLDARRQLRVGLRMGPAIRPVRAELSRTSRNPRRSAAFFGEVARANGARSLDDRPIRRPRSFGRDPRVPILAPMGMRGRLRHVAMLLVWWSCAWLRRHGPPRQPRGAACRPPSRSRSATAPTGNARSAA